MENFLRLKRAVEEILERLERCEEREQRRERELIRLRQQMELLEQENYRLKEERAIENIKLELLLKEVGNR
jgi:hypothetical protein